MGSEICVPQDLNESRSEILTRIQNLKQVYILNSFSEYVILDHSRPFLKLFIFSFIKDLQSWRSKLDTQVKTYRDVSITRLYDLMQLLSFLISCITLFHSFLVILQLYHHRLSCLLKNS